MLPSPVTYLVTGRFDDELDEAKAGTFVAEVIGIRTNEKSRWRMMTVRRGLFTLARFPRNEVLLTILTIKHERLFGVGFIKEHSVLCRLVSPRQT